MGGGSPKDSPGGKEGQTWLSSGAGKDWSSDAGVPELTDANWLSPPILSLSLLIPKWGNTLSQAVDSQALRVKWQRRLTDPGTGWDPAGPQAHAHARVWRPLPPWTCRSVSVSEDGDAELSPQEDQL